MKLANKLWWKLLIGVSTILLLLTYFLFCSWNLVLIPIVILALCCLYYLTSFSRFNKWFGVFSRPFYVFVEPFGKDADGNNIKSFWIIVFVFIIPILIVLINHHFNFNFFRQELCLKYAKIDVIPFWGIWLSVMGILISSRVYFEISDKNSLDFDQFTTVVLNDFVDNCGINDEINIILPTPFIGYNLKRKFHIKFKEKILELAKAESKNFNLAVLAYDIQEIQTLYQKIQMYNNSYLEPYKNELNSILLVFHNKWYYKNPKSDKEDAIQRGEYFKELCEFIIELESCVSGNFKIKHIKRNYFIDGNGNQGFGNTDIFLLSNITRGNFILGDLKILEQESIIFEQNSYTNTNLGEEFNCFFNTFISRRI